MSAKACPDCGGELDLDNESHAGLCPLCGADPSDFETDDAFEEREELEEIEEMEEDQ